jgi:hypothetical protein
VIFVAGIILTFGKHACLASFPLLGATTGVLYNCACIFHCSDNTITVKCTADLLHNSFRFISLLGQTAEAIDEQEHLISTSWNELTQKSKTRRKKLEDSLQLYNLGSTVSSHQTLT